MAEIRNGLSGVSISAVTIVTGLYVLGGGFMCSKVCVVLLWAVWWCVFILRTYAARNASTSDVKQKWKEREIDLLNKKIRI